MLFLCFLVASLNLIFIRVNWKAYNFSSLSLHPTQIIDTSPALPQQSQSSLAGRLPKIFWLYTENEYGT